MSKNINTWRDTARPIITKVLQETNGQDEKVIKKALYNAYPFGERRYHPYKVWLDEIRVQQHKRKFGIKNKVPKNQMKMF